MTMGGRRRRLADDAAAPAPLARLRQQGPTSARSVGFDQFGATMGRTGRSNLMHYTIGDSA